MSAGKKRMRLGEILINQGIITADDLERALFKQKREGGLLGEVLLRMGLVSEEDIVIALAKQFNIPYIPVKNCDISQKILEYLPSELAVKYIAIPIDSVGDVLTVVMADPTNQYAVDDMEKVSGMRLQVLVDTATEIVKAIKKFYKINSLKLGEANLSDENFKSVN